MYKCPRVVVVGAGLAGLTTAFRLHQKGMDVLVFEARNRIGGRVFTVKIEDTIVELGGQNISDGGGAENLYRLIKEFDVELKENKYNLKYSYFTGEKMVPVHDLLKKKNYHPENLKTKLNEIAGRSRTMQDVLREMLDEDDPLYKAMSVRLSAYEGAPVEKLSPIYKETLYHMLLGGITSVYQKKDNIENYASFFSMKDGNVALLEKIAQRLENKVYLNKPLTKISKKSDGSFVLTFQDNDKVDADILVLAIPCSVYEDIVFDEHVLPSENLATIKNVQYGTNAKILTPLQNPPSKSMLFANDRIVSGFDASRKILNMYFTGEASKFSETTIRQTFEKEKPMIDAGFGKENLPVNSPTIANDHSFYSYSGPVGHSWPNDRHAKGSYS